MAKKRILLKLTGEVFGKPHEPFSADTVTNLIEQIKQLEPTHQFGIVIGGGNFFRGSKQGKELGLNAETAHQVGMLATMMNGMMLQNLFEKHGVSTKLFSAINCPEVTNAINQHAIHNALLEEKTVIFSGGTGNPFFTTDTNAVLRSLQISADEIWKGTSIDGVYTKDPATHADAQLLTTVTYAQAIEQRLGIMDLTAYSMAQQHKQQIRVFNIFAPHALYNAAQDNNFGSIIA
jgi:uridylate kinase